MKGPGAFNDIGVLPGRPKPHGVVERFFATFFLAASAGVSLGNPDFRRRPADRDFYSGIALHAAIGSARCKRPSLRQLDKCCFGVNGIQTSRPLRSYLKLRRTQTILWTFVATSLLLLVFSQIDIHVSRLFFDHGFYMANQNWTRVLHFSVTWFIGASIASVTAIYVFNQLSSRAFCGIDGKKVVYLLLVLVLGAGLVVNGILKSEFGRARPKDIVEFGGAAEFTPAYVVSSNCPRNCSFSSGDAAGAFFALAFAVAVSRRRWVVTVAVGFGVLVSAARIASGSHFLSDTVVSFFVMLILADALHYRMFLFDPRPSVQRPVAPAPGRATVFVRVTEKASALPEVVGPLT